MTARGIVDLAVSATMAVLFAALGNAQTLPILLTPPLHYQVLQKLDHKGEMGGSGGAGRGIPPAYGVSKGSFWNRSILERWLRTAQNRGANALLLRPMCRSSWVCSGRTFERYAAEAIRVQGALCDLPFQCWSIRQVIISNHRWRRMYHKDSNRFFSLGGSYGMSVAVSGTMQAHLGTPIGHLTSHLRGRLQCPIRDGFGDANYGDDWLPLVATPALAVVGTSKRIATDRLIIPGSEVDIDTDRLIARILRHWRFRGTGVGTGPMHLLMDWHLVALRKGQPLPRGVVCVYPAYPSTGWNGRMVRHLRWRVYALRVGTQKILYAVINPDSAH